jgi:hypothetical protein
MHWIVNVYFYTGTTQDRHTATEKATCSSMDRTSKCDGETETAIEEEFLPWEITFSTFCSAYSSEKHVACIQ